MSNYELFETSRRRHAISSRMAGKGLRHLEICTNFPLR
jgi:hypothetical protein